MTGWDVMPARDGEVVVVNHGRTLRQRARLGNGVMATIEIKPNRPTILDHAFAARLALNFDSVEIIDAAEGSWPHRWVGNGRPA